jgi:hypothetical protein
MFASSWTDSWGSCGACKTPLTLSDMPAGADALRRRVKSTADTSGVCVGAPRNNYYYNIKIVVYFRYL